MAALALGAIGLEAAAAVPRLIQKLSDSHEKSRTAAMIALGQIGDAPPKAVNMLVKMFTDEETGAESQRHLARFIGRLGDRAKGAIPGLVRALERTGGAAKAYCARAAGELRAEQALPVLRRSLIEAHPRIRAEAALALWRIERSPDSLPTLLTVLTCRDKEVRAIVAEALTELGGDAPTLLANAPPVREEKKDGE